MSRSLGVLLILGFREERCISFSKKSPRMLVLRLVLVSYKCQLVGEFSSSPNKIISAICDGLSAYNREREQCSLISSGSHACSLALNRQIRWSVVIADISHKLTNIR